MSNTVIRNFTDLNGPSAKADSSLVVIVNKDGSISLDKDILQNLMNDRVHSTAISVVRVGEDGRPDDASESDSDEAGRPHVNLTVDGYYVDPDVGEYADDLLSALSVETNSNSLVGFQNDHCYTPLTSPSQCLPQRSNTTSKIEKTESFGSKSVNLKTNIPSSKKITILNQQIIQKGKPILQINPSENRIIVKGSDLENKTHLSPFKRVSETEMSQEPQITDYKSLSDKNTGESKNIHPGESTASTDTSSSESPTSDQDSDSDYREKFTKKLSGRPSKNKQLKGIKKIFTKKHGKIKLVREGKILAAPKSIKALKTGKTKSTLQDGNASTKTLGTKVKQAVVKKIKRKQEEKLSASLVAEEDIPVHPTPLEQRGATPKSQKLLLKKEKKTPSHVTALLSDMTSLFSTPDVIRSASTEYKSATKPAEKPISKKVLLESSKHFGHEFETKPNIDAQFKHVPYQRTYSKQKYVKELGPKIMSFKESKDHIDIIPQLDEASLAQLLQEGTAEMLPSSSSMLQDTQTAPISKEGMSTSATIVSNPITMNATTLTGPLSPSLDLLAGFKPEEAGLTEDLLMHVAQLVESSENLQEVIDKQVLGKISISESHKVPQITPQVDYEEMLNDDLSSIKVHKIPLPPRKDPILIRRSDGRVITLPPIEAPATRASKRKSQHTPYELPVAAAAPSLAPATVLAPPIDHSPQLSPQLTLHLTSQEHTRQYSNKKVAQLVTSPQRDKVVAESDDSWNSEDDPDRLWCICKQPHNNRFMICCDRCEDWFHGKCVNITKAMGQQMEEKGVEWTCPNCLKKDRERAQIGKTLTPKALTSNSRKSADMAPKDHTKNLSKIEQPRKSPTAGSTSGSACIVCNGSARASSIYCSDACIRRHAQDSLGSGATGYSPATSRPGQRPTTQATRGAGKPESRVIVFERKTGKLLSGATAPTAENLKQWLLDHPTFEVVRPGTLPSPTKAGPSKQLAAKQLATTKLNDSKQLDATKVLETTKQLSTTSPPEGSKQPGTKQLNKQPALTKQDLAKTQVMAKQQASTKLQASTKQQVLSKQDITKMLTSTKQQTSSQQAINKTPGKVVPAKVQSILKFERIPRLTQSPQPQQKMLTPTHKAVEATASVSTPVLKQTVPKPLEIKKTPAKSTEKPSNIKSPPTPTNHRRKDSSSEVQAKPHMTAVEPIRDNVRKALQEQLSIRMSENTGYKFDLEQVKTFAIQTELELYDLFKDVGMKYKAKYRSLMFNIKDRRNLSLWQKICDRSITPKQLVRLSPEELASQELAQWRDAEAKHQLELIKKNELDLMNCTKTYVLKTHKGEEVMETKSSAPELDPNVSVEDLVSALNDSAATEPDTELPKNTEHPVLKRHKSSRNKSLSIDSNEYNTDVLKGDRSRRSSKSDATKEDPSIHLHKVLKDSDTKDIKTDKDKNKRKKSMRARSRSRDKTRGMDQRDKSRGRSKHSSSSGDHSRQRSRSRDLSKHRTRSRDRHRRSKSKSPDKEEGTKHRTRSRDRLSSRRRSRSREKAKHRSRSKHRASSKPRRYSTERSERSMSQQMSSKHRSHSKDIDHNEAEPERPKSANQRQLDIHPEYDPHEPMITSAFSEEDLQKSQDADEEETFGDENLIDATAPSMEHDLARVTSRHSTRIPASAPPTKVSQLLSAGDDHDQEPSSTVEISPPKVVWNGCINMVDVARFYVAAHQVSGSCDELEEDLAPELDVVGRINPDTVWDYITKMRKTSNKEILVLRLTAANDEEKMQYIALYTYLSTRNRMGVVKVSMAMPVKDVYILPLSGQAPVPGALQPLHPGFEEPRPPLLIGIIVRQRKKLSDLIPAKITRRKSSAAVRSYTPPVSSDVVETDSYTPPSSPARRLTRSRDARALPLPASLSVSAPITDSMTKTLTGFPALSSSVKDKIAASLAAADDEPYSPGGSDSSSTQQSAASRDKEDIQREMEQLNREIEEQKQQIQNMSVVAIEELDEPYSPSRPMTPPPASSGPTPAPISMSDISLPSNLQEILANIQKKSQAGPLPSNVGMGDVDMRLLPPLPEMPYQMPPVPAPPACFPPAPTPSKLSTLSEAELLSMVPDDATPPHKRRRFSQGGQSGGDPSDATR